MNTSTPRFFALTRFSLWFAALAAALSLGSVTRAAQDDRGTFFASVPVPSAVSKSELPDILVAVLQGREWGVKSKADGAVVGYLKHRSNEATVTLAYDGTKVDIYCVGYQIDKKTGERVKPEQPKGWLKNIQSDLTKRFNRGATQG